MHKWHSTCVLLAAGLHCQPDTPLQQVSSLAAADACLLKVVEGGLDNSRNKMRVQDQFCTTKKEVAT